MDDVHISTDATDAVTPAAPKASATRPTHQGPIDQTRDLAKKVLGMITGRAKG
jgi:hypothetical protein